MVPNHSRRGNTVYHYYISSPLVRGSKTSRRRKSLQRIKKGQRRDCRIETRKAVILGRRRDSVYETGQKITLLRDELEIQLKSSANSPSLLRVCVSPVRGIEGAIRTSD